MAWFTLELWKVLEIEDDAGDGRKIGLDSYPIPSGWEETDRDALNKKIIDHYWNREIGRETISLFELSLRRKLNEVMPLYVQLYESCTLKFDPLSTFDLSTVRNDDTTENITHGSTSNSAGTSTGTSRTVTSNPPQTQLSRNGQYATNVVDSESSGASTSNSNGQDTTTGDSKLSGTSATTGRQGSANRLLAEYRSNILNIDLMVLSDLDELFIGVWDSNTELLPEEGAYF